MVGIDMVSVDVERVESITIVNVAEGDRLLINHVVVRRVGTRRLTLRIVLPVVHSCWVARGLGSVACQVSGQPQALNR